MIRGIVYIALSFLCLKYRERMIGFTGKFGWAEHYLGTGGSYTAVVIFSIVLFFWGVANLTGTTDVLLSPLRGLFPGGAPEPSSGFDPAAF